MPYRKIKGAYEWVDEEAGERAPPEFPGPGGLWPPGHPQDYMARTRGRWPSQYPEDIEAARLRKHGPKTREQILLDSLAQYNTTPNRFDAQDQLEREHYEQRKRKTNIVSDFIDELMD